MSPNAPIIQLLQTLEACGIRYMVTGSWASSAHGRPRATRDVDVVIACLGSQIDRLRAALDTNDWYMDPAAAREAVRDRGMFNVLHVASGWKFDLIVCKDRPFSVCELGRRLQRSLGTHDVWMASPEDVILSKLEWAVQSGSSRQLEDAAGIVATRRDSLDLDYITEWASELGVRDAWETIRKAY